MKTKEEVEAEAEERLARGRAIIRVKGPYMATTIYSFIPYMYWGLKTMGVTEKLILAVDPLWLCTIEDKHIAAALFHESQHVVRNHHIRMKAFPDKERANAAGDLAINPGMRAAGWELPHAIYPEDYGFPEELSMEEYYKLLEQYEQKQQQQPKRQQKQGKGKGNSSQSQQGQQGGTEQEQEQEGGGQGQSSLPNGHPPGIGAGRCGSCAGHNLPGEAQINDPGRSEADVRSVIKQGLNEIKQWAEQHGRGSVPAGLLTEVENNLRPDDGISWERELSHIIRKCSSIIEAGGMDYSLARPSKRSYARGFPRPGLVQHIPEIAFALDTSGSMGVKQIKDALSHAISICKALGVEEVSLIQADADVHETKRVRIRELLGKVRIHGGGGTSFDPALKKAETLKPRPELLIYLTDGDGNASFRPRGMQVVWVIVRSYYNKKPCDWGHTVIVAEKNKRGKVSQKAFASNFDDLDEGADDFI